MALPSGVGPDSLPSEGKKQIRCRELVFPARVPSQVYCQHSYRDDDPEERKDNPGGIHQFPLPLQHPQRDFLLHSWQHITHSRIPSIIVWHSAGRIVMVFTDIGP